MIQTWMLVILITGWGGYSTKVDFSSKELCNKALKEFSDNWVRGVPGTIVCVETT